MQKIGNIVTKGNKNIYNQLFNVVNSLSEIDNELPTLFIGWELAKQNIKNINILQKKYGKISWTFTKRERKCDNDVDIVKFYEECLTIAMEKIKFIHINLLTYNYNKIKKIITYLKNNNIKKYIFFTKDSNYMFIYSEGYKTVFGISLSFCEYINIQKKKIWQMIKNKEVISDTKFIDSDIRRIIGSNTHYILPLYCFFQN